MSITAQKLREFPVLKMCCESIIRRKITNRTWWNWSAITKALFPPGSRLKNRIYSEEEVELFLSLAILRSKSPLKKIDYESLKIFNSSNAWKIHLAIEKFNKGETWNPNREDKTYSLRDLHRYCSEILAKPLHRSCFCKWKKHLSIDKYEKTVGELEASLLVFISCYRRDNPNKSLPSKRQLMYLAAKSYKPNLGIEGHCSYHQKRKWDIHGCYGHEIPAYLNSWGIKISIPSLYRWGGYSKSKKYSPSELRRFKDIALTNRRRNSGYHSD